MTHDETYHTFLNCLIEVFPEVSSRKISPQDSLRDLGANSVDRAEIIMLTLSCLKIHVPLINFAQAKNIGDLVDIFHYNATKT